MRRTHGPRSGHPPGCFGCKILTVHIGAEATPTRVDARYTEITNREKAMERDFPAYRTLRKQGIQPPTAFGAADLAARADSRIEIETGGRVKDTPVVRDLAPQLGIPL